jgi:uracil-DNA glycosylase
MVVALGATAAQSLMGAKFRLTAMRGQVLSGAHNAIDALPDGDFLLVATIHPSAVLRAPDRDRAFDGLVADLRTAALALEDPAPHHKARW